MGLFSKSEIELKPGNKCLFLLFVSFNFFVFLAGLGLFSLSIYLLVLLKGANTFNVVFLSISVALFLLSACSFKLRNSIHMLGMYLFIQAINFTALLIMSLILLLAPDTVSEWAKEVYDKNAIANPDETVPLESYITIFQNNV